MKKLLSLPKSSLRWSFAAGLLTLIAFALRVYNLPNTVQFLGDQGRDALIVSRIFRFGDLVFIGPVTSVGNMYLGPLYYYFMLPFLRLSYPSPLGPVYAIAILGTIAVACTYYLGKDLIGKTAALIGAFFLTFSYLAVEYSRFSWNPNPAPLVSIIMIWATFKAWTKNKWYWVVVALCFSILIQLHYLSLLSAAGAGAIWLVQLIESVRKSPSARKKALMQITLATTAGAIVLLTSLVPLFLFDYKHNWLNFKAFANLFSGEQAFTTSDTALSLTEKIGAPLLESHGRSMHILFEIAIGQDRGLNSLLVLTVLLLLAWKISRRSSNTHWHGEVVLTTYLLTGIIGTAFYKHSVFHHYIAYLWPVTFLIYGVVISQARKHFITLLLAVAFTILFLRYNSAKWPFKNIGLTIAQVQINAKTISDRVKPGEKYNIVLLTETGDIDGQNYRYFLESTATPPVPTEKRGEVETLFIINEDRKLKKVTDSPIYEIVVFPNKNPAEVYTLESGTEVTVLRAN